MHICRISLQRAKSVIITTYHNFQLMKLAGLSSCLSHMPDQLIDQILSADCEGPDAIYRGTFVRCYLVSNGHQPIALLNSCVDAAFNNKDW